MSVRSKPNWEDEAPAEPYFDVDDLPDGWTAASLGQLTRDISYGYTAKATENDVGPKLLRITDIQDNAVNWNTVPFCQIDDHRIESYRLSPGDLVFARTGATTGKSFLIKTCPASVFASYLIRVRPSPALLPDYVAAFFQTRDYWNQITENLSGSAQPNCNASKLASLTVPIAPLAEQRRIVRKLDSLLGKVSSSRQRLSRVPGLLKRFRQSVLAAACSGKLTADWREENGVAMEDWNESKLLDLLAEPLANGRSVRDAIDGFPVLRLTCLKNGRIDLAERKIGEWTKKDAQRFLVKKDDYLVSRGNGSHSLVGRGGLVVDEPDDVAYPDTLIRMRLQQAIMSPEFVSSIWNSPQIRSQIEAAAHTSAGIWKISQADIEGFVIPVPPLSEQQGIVRRVEKLFTFADQIEARLRQAQSHVDRLTQSVLAKAFRGELVPTEAKLARHENRSYDPASELLARIQADREQSGELSKVSTKRARAATRK
jgi:type I restriction enzyme, S subunit